MDSIKKITIYDIAREAGISASQVSRAISGNGYVSEENRVKVQELIEKYNYKPSAMARNLQKGRTNTIGFLVPHISKEYFPSIYYVFEREMTEKGYITVVFNGKSYIKDEARNIRLLEEIRVDAVVIMGGGLDGGPWNAEYEKLVRDLNSKIPCVLCTDRAGELDCPGVCSDIDKGMAFLMEHLNTEGYKKVGILGGYKSIYPSLRVKNAVKRLAAGYGMEVRPEWDVDSSYDELDGEEAMKALLQQKELPEVVCCINDDIAVGAMGAAMDAGLRIPQDIAFAGYDGLPISDAFRPRLTTVQMDFEKMGCKLVEAVEKSLSGDRSTELTMIDPWLEIRESTRRSLFPS